MPRVIVVVARERTELFQYFDQVFAGMQDIKVILDRRLGTASAGPYPPGEPGRRERRDIYDELQTRGFVIIRLW